MNDTQDQALAAGCDGPDDGCRPYHHGDLRRGLIEAARAILETQGPAALSLRAVARAAGVSPAAPYHHFKDKSALLGAVGHEGWVMLGAVLEAARSQTRPGRAVITALGVAYVGFALDHPALYRVMYDHARDKEALPDYLHDPEHGAFARVRDTLVRIGGDPQARIDLELATTAAWCAAHGLAEMAGFRQFDHLKAALGGERPFLRAVFDHMALFPRPLAD